jgi:putative membrane protein insertion efficiency factor
MFSSARKFMTLLVMLPVQAYRIIISPFIGVNCRFQPSCSEYTLDAIRLHGPIKGGYLSARRILRCHPLGGSGYDAVPGVGASSDSSAKKIPLDN